MTEVSQDIHKLVILQEDTKLQIRDKVWDYLEVTRLTNPGYGSRRRISNFKGSDEAGVRVAEMEVFKNAKVVRIDPNIPLQEIRIKTLEAGKTLLLPTPKLLNHVFSKIVPPAEADAKTLRNCVNRRGLNEHSQPVSLDDQLKVDLIIVGCIAVSKTGRKVGKGGGLSDLEYAMMASLNFLEENVPVITLVHDDQVVDLPESIFMTYDLPVDYIVTPTQVIKCTGGLKKPPGVMWNIIDQKRIGHIPVLNRIRYRNWKEGMDVRLEGEEEQPEKLEDVVSNEPEEVRVYRRNPLNRRRRETEEGETTGDEDRNAGRRKPVRNNKRMLRTKKTVDRLGSEGLTDEDKGKREEPNGELRQVSESRRRPGRNMRRGGRNSDSTEGCVYVGSLPRGLRVSEFKTEVRGRKVNPVKVLWRGQMGFAFLNFRTHVEAEQALAALEGLSISDHALKLEMAKSSNDKNAAEDVKQLVDQGDGDKKIE